MRKVNETPEETIRRLNIPKMAAKADIKQQGRLETKRAAVRGCGPARLNGRPGCGQARGRPQRHLQVLGKTECQNSQGHGDSGVRTTWLDTEQV